MVSHAHNYTTSVTSESTNDPNSPFFQPPQHSCGDRYFRSIATTLLHIFKVHRQQRTPEYSVHTPFFLTDFLSMLSSNSIHAIVSYIVLFFLRAIQCVCVCMNTCLYRDINYEFLTHFLIWAFCLFPHLCYYTKCGDEHRCEYILSN